MKYFVLQIFLIISFFLFPVKVFAVGTTFGVSPAVIENVFDKGEEGESVITVFNPTFEYIPIKVQFSSFNLKMEYYDELEVADFKKLDSSSWLSSDLYSFFLEPNSSKEVHIKTTVPNDAEPGGHYATVYFQPLIDSTVLNPSVSFVSSKVGVLIFNTVKGDIHKKTSLKDFSVKRYVHIGGDISFNYGVKNDGNVHALLSPIISVKSNITGETYKQTVKPNIIMPFTTNRDEIILDKNLGHGYYTAVGTFGEDSLSVDFLVITWLDISIVMFTFFVLFIILSVKTKKMLLIFRILTGKNHIY